MKHSERVEKYPGTLRELARDLVNMRYDSLAEFYKCLSEELLKDAGHDKSLGHKKVSDILELISKDNSEVEKKCSDLWKICEKYMI